MTEPDFPGKVVGLHQALRDAGIPHAFGGAIALVYYGEPRATIDIDINVFLDSDSFRSLETVLESTGVEVTVTPSVVERDGQFSGYWNRTRVDIFLAYDAVHDAMRRQARTVPFEGIDLPILSPEHLIVCKVVFDRTKDWSDLEPMMVGVPHLDVEEILKWREHIVGTTDERYRRAEELLARREPSTEPNRPIDWPRPPE